ncbi:MAG: MlaD family protein [Bacteroidota bacterium]
MTRSVRIGLTVVAAIVAIYLIIAWSQRIHFFSPSVQRYTLKFQDVSGLLVGDPVKMRGYQAGRVESIRPSQEAVYVTVTLDEEILLFQDAYAEIQLKELMGGKQVYLLPGQKGRQLSVQDTLRGNTAWDFAASFSEFGQVADQISLQGLDRKLGKLDSLFQWMSQMSQHIDPEAPGRIVSHLDEASRDLVEVTALAKEKDWLSDIQEKSRQLDTLLADASRMMAHTDEMIQQIEVDQVSHTLVQSQELIQRLNHQMDHLEKLLTQVENSESLLNRLVYDSTLSRQVDTTLYNLNKTLEQIHSKKVIVGLNRKRQK